MLIDDVADYLVAMGMESGGWVVTKGQIPDRPDKVIMVFPSTGLPPDTLGRENERPGLMVQIRSSQNDFRSGYEKWQAVYDALKDACQTSGSPVLLPGFVYIQPKHSGPIPFRDPEQRWVFSSNWRTMITGV